MRSVGFVALSSLPLAVSAQQIRTSVVLGGVRVRYADAIDANAVTLSPAMTLQSGRKVLALDGTVSQPTLGAWTAQGSLAGSAFRSLSARFALEGGVNGGASTSGDGAGTGNGQLLGRIHALSDRMGAWMGAGTGTVWLGDAWQSTHLAELGAWAQWNALGAVATLTPTVANDSVTYADLLLSLRLRARRFELDGTIGHRAGNAATVAFGGPRDWLSATASYRVSSRIAAIVGAGTYPVDLLQGFPSGRYMSFGVRFTGPGSGSAPAFARGADEMGNDRLVRTGVSALRTRSLAPGRLELRARLIGATTVEVVGDLSGWEPVAMRAEPDGWWVIELEGDPGTYELNLRRDGGEWLAPPGLVHRRDEFGGVSGVIRLR